MEADGGAQGLWTRSAYQESHTWPVEGQNVSGFHAHGSGRVSEQCAPQYEMVAAGGETLPMLWLLYFNDPPERLRQTREMAELGDHRYLYLAFADDVTTPITGTGRGAVRGMACARADHVAEIRGEEEGQKVARDQARNLTKSTQRLPDGVFRRTPLGGWPSTKRRLREQY